jgi:streptogramin lyase
MRRPRVAPAAAGLAALCLALSLTGCQGARDRSGQAGSATTSPPGSTAPTTSTNAPAPSAREPTVQAVIDLDGMEAYGLAVHREAVWAITYQDGTLSRVDPRTGRVSLRQRLPAVATLASAAGGLWAAAYGTSGSDASVFRIDPATAKAAVTVEAGEVCCDLTAGDGSVWAVDPHGTVVRIDPRRGRVAQRIQVRIDSTVHTNAVFAGRFLWVSSDSTPLLRVDPRTGRTTEIDVGGGVPFLADRGLLWGAAPELLWAVDAATSKVVRRIPLQDSMEVLSLGVGFGAIWVGIRHPGRIGALLRLEPGSGKVLGELDDIEIPARIAFGFGSVWVTDSASGSLYRIAPGA